MCAVATDRNRSLLGKWPCLRGHFLFLATRKAPEPERAAVPGVALLREVTVPSASAGLRSGMQRHGGSGAALVMMRVPERQLLAAVRRAERVVDIEDLHPARLHVIYFLRWQNR